MQFLVAMATQTSVCSVNSVKCVDIDFISWM